ncbi:intraflagellar transport protein 25 homolog [Hemicordylus capensis]|uniref:intraflagellar transport protein 25 homolog n=1 Tax=Hemicordylus capensis TaxID=884348 RepID=UPI00230403EC|nr:intraflagellar transport protein 25 homolog [Hemicordylus capensis]XP_053104199.1 intraflagellar transport protein 25 homolog [Hemicordylus capensis]XP_053104200.1 intraflagellar transport protein 25 homolog [Hemicordylus capensis]
MRSTDFCLSSEGADVILATSSDENFPPENITDGRSDTFWTTTGMFPQEFIICFHRCVSISKLTVQCYLVRMLRIEKSMSKDPVDFEHCIEKELQYKEGELQTEEFSLPELQATHLRFIILSGYDAFVSIHRLIADGIAQEI